MNSKCTHHRAGAATASDLLISIPAEIMQIPRLSLNERVALAAIAADPYTTNLVLEKNREPSPLENHVLEMVVRILLPQVHCRSDHYLVAAFGSFRRIGIHHFNYAGGNAAKWR